VFGGLKRQFGRLTVRLLLVNGVVVLVPIAGLEFAQLFERELLASLERDMRNQAIVVRRFLEVGSDSFAPELETALQESARDTRTRVRVLDVEARVRLDSHAAGPPEGEEGPPPRMLGSGLSTRNAGLRWTELKERSEVRAALGGTRSAYTRIREREPSVFLFVTEPFYRDARVEGVVYVTRSTRPVMVELYRIRGGLQQVALLAVAFTVAVTLWLGLSITRPLERLSRVAAKIASGQTDLAIPVSGSGELRDIGAAFRTMTERLRQRMHDTAAFAADVAHAFKSPLTSIRGAAELLSQGAADDPTARQRFLRNIALDSERLDRLVSRLLQLSRLDASTGSLEPLPLLALLTETAERSSTPDVAVVVSAETDGEGVSLNAAVVRGRKEELETAFANLFDNAVRFSPPGSPVNVVLTRGNGVYRVHVQDEGPGISAELRPRLFQRFFTTDSDQGTGLGLAIVRSVIEAHGGNVDLAPSERGAHFVVELPVPAPRTAAAPIGRGANVFSLRRTR
jgi:two-component system, OmpR family, sensor histidine kinase ChvG